MKILVVEDENALREVIVRSLEKERYVVESASSFREASLKINDYDYDCIVLDIMLPGMFRTGWRSIRLCLPIWRKRVGRNDSRMRH